MRAQQTQLHLVPSLEDFIRVRRRCIAVCPMVKTLDQRIAHQRDLVDKILSKYNITIDQIRTIPIKEIGQQPIEIQLCYHILRDCDYIDSLR